MTNDSLLPRMQESSLSISLTVVLVVAVVVIVSSITIQSVYMWVVVGIAAILLLCLCSCSACDKSSHLVFRRASVHSDSVSTISDGRNFFTVTCVANPSLATVPDIYPATRQPRAASDPPPSYAVATAATPSYAPESQAPPPYCSVVNGAHGQVSKAHAVVPGTQTVAVPGAHRAACGLLLANGGNDTSSSA